MVVGSDGDGSGSYDTRNTSAIRRKHKKPVRISMSQLALYGRSIVELTMAAVSSTQPPAVIQLRSGCGDLKNVNAGWLVWLSSTSTNQLSQGWNRSSSIRSSKPIRV